MSKITSISSEPWLAAPNAARFLAAVATPFGSLECLDFLKTLVVARAGNLTLLRSMLIGAADAGECNTRSTIGELGWGSNGVVITTPTSGTRILIEIRDCWPSEPLAAHITVQFTRPSVSRAAEILRALRHENLFCQVITESEEQEDAMVWLYRHIEESDDVTGYWTIREVPLTLPTWEGNSCGPWFDLAVAERIASNLWASNYLGCNVVSRTDGHLWIEKVEV